MLEVQKYTIDKKNDWDHFVSNAKNGTFLFYRDYMEYHADRFEDYSLMIYSKNKLVALLPANVVGDTVYSHQGLTFGGIILNNKFHYQDALYYLNSVTRFLNFSHIKILVLKIPPYFYAKNLSQDLNLLILRNKTFSAKITLGAAINTYDYTFPKRCVRQNKLDMYDIIFDYNLDSYWDILNTNLKERHDSKPVHNLVEIQKLKNNFPKNIQLLSLKNSKTDKVDAGALIYLSDNIAKVQYFATTTEGRSNRASDVLYYNIIKHYKMTCQFIDFGTCEEGDNRINMQLLETKEKFGANTFPIYSHQLETKNTLTL